MPIVQVNMMEGRTQKQKEDLIAEAARIGARFD